MGAIDPRFYQIGSLLLMLLMGLVMRDFPIEAPAGAVVMGTVWAVQSIGILWLGLPWASLMSATISGLSLLLLARGSSLMVLALAAFLSIAVKFVFTWDKKHFFNPTNFGIIATMLVTGNLWVSPGQWGEGFILGFWLLLLGIVVVTSSWRWDITAFFLLFYGTMLFTRVMYLGQPYAVLFHQLNNGALIIFSFFMISDPRSTPNHIWGRLLFAAGVAALGFYLRFHYFLPHSLLLALFLISPLTPLLDKIWKLSRFEWLHRGKQYESAAWLRHGRKFVS